MSQDPVGQPVMPPDMVSAGVMPQGQAPVNLMSALSAGAGGVPTDALHMLLASQAPPDPTMTGLNALGAGVFAGRGQANPIAAQQLAQQQEQRLQQDMIQRAQDRRQMMMDKKTTAAQTVLKDLLFGPHAVEDEATRTALAGQHKSLIEQTTGVQVPPSILTSWSRGGPTQESNKQIATYLAAADTEEDPRIKTVLEQKAKDFYAAHGGSPLEWDATNKMLRNPTLASKFGLPDPEQRLTKHYEMETKRIDAWKAKNPDWQDQGELKNLASWGNEWTQKYDGRNIYALTPDNPLDKAVLDAAHAYAVVRGKQELQSKEQRDLEKFREQAKITQGEMLARQKELLVAKPAMTFTQQQTALDKFQPVNVGMSEIAAARHDWEDAASRGLLPSTTGPGAAWMSKINQWWNTNDPALVRLRAFIAPVSIGIIDRGLNDEKGGRAFKMFEEQVKIVRDSPTKEGFERLFGTYEYLLGQAAQHRLDFIERSRAKLPDEFVEEAQARVRKAFPNGFPQDPTAPKTGEGPLADPKTLYSQLRRQGMTPPEAKAELQRRGFNVQ